MASGGEESKELKALPQDDEVLKQVQEDQEVAGHIPTTGLPGRVRRQHPVGSLPLSHWLRGIMVDIAGAEGEELKDPLQEDEIPGHFQEGLGAQLRNAAMQFACVTVPLKSEELCARFGKTSASVRQLSMLSSDRFD